VNPNKRQAVTVCKGIHLPRMTAANAMNPLPDDMLREKDEAR
jgi:hypothetical protein